MNDLPIDPERIADETARHLLERASEIDSAHVSLAQLREAASEAGISPAAFDAAVAEWRRADIDVKPGRRRFAWAEELLRNVAGLAAGWAGVAAFAMLDRIVAAPWLVHKLTDPIGLALGALVALKLRARTAAVVVSGLAVSQLAEFLMDLFTGAPAIRGLAAHMGLMIAGVVGVALGSRLLRGPGGSAPPRPATVDTVQAADRDTASDPSASQSVGLPDGDAERRFVEVIRLRHHGHLTRLQPG